MIVKLLTEHHLEFFAQKEAADAASLVSPSDLSIIFIG